MAWIVLDFGVGCSRNYLDADVAGPRLSRLRGLSQLQHTGRVAVTAKRDGETAAGWRAD